MTHDYLTHKVRVLGHLGLTNKKALKAYLQSQVVGLAGEKREIRLDNISRSLLMAYYDGDYTFVKTESEEEERANYSSLD